MWALVDTNHPTLFTGIYGTRTAARQARLSGTQGVIKPVLVSLA